MVGVKGRLFCGSQPLNNTQIKLWNKNTLASDNQLAAIKPMPTRKVQLGVPAEYVTRSDQVTKWFEAGTMNMEFIFPDEERSCIN
uniref:Uncharacterized protein n=1 Tax=Ditylenchus dipsaci TaxID=166011 RepID=A0A915ERK3_9BILA